jgi:uracil-DNA glycosylase
MTQDSLSKIAADLATYLKQQQDSGVEYYFAGDLGDPPPVMQAPPKPAKADPAPALDAEADPFTADCHDFVKATLEQISAYSQQAAAPAETDIFTREATASGSLSLTQKEAALAAMAAEVAACQACKLHSGRNNTVFGHGSADADLLLIGEAPGKDEDEQGLPFVGRSGKLLTGILKAIEFDREDVYICNILKCRPPQNRDPEADEVSACEAYLKRQLEIIQPKVILCLGRHAAMTLLQTKASLKSMRESVHFYHGVPVMATFHPAALLRNPHWKRDTWDDVRKLRALHDALVASRA